MQTGGESLPGNPLVLSESGNEYERWKRMSAKDLRASTVVFQSIQGARVIDYVSCLKQHGFDARDILSIQQVSVTGAYRLTLSSKAMAENICEEGFVFNSVTVTAHLLDTSNSRPASCARCSRMGCRLRTYWGPRTVWKNCRYGETRQGSSRRRSVHCNWGKVCYFCP